MRRFLLFMTALLLTCCSSDCEVKGISHVNSDVKKSKVYTLQGTLALVGQNGIVIKDGKKVAIK